ncbi:MAG: recombination factor protein RarA [Gammaproteobacteria bacterium]|nr:recombination factor protein RarA [Gammaproteobacteria bacterium]|tara:strand:+ start:543 stop:1847 length:1305 start_codon:yes stop_codon:yes gene_type:complete
MLLGDDQRTNALDDAPLAERLRPTTLAEFVGQRHLLGQHQPLAKLAASGRLHSMVLWGPPGTGKTTLAKLLAERAGARWVSLSAVLAGVKDVRQAVEQAQAVRNLGESTVLFVDEVHRFNKAQQDAFLPHVEKGTITFIGATTENPSFEVNAALLSRARVYVLRALEDAELNQVIDRAIAGPVDAQLSDEARRLLVSLADGDARRLLNLLDVTAQLADGFIDEALVSEAAGSRYRRFDKGGDQFYEQISALHKAVRGSAVDAALYWLCRMLDGGCDPLYIARRVLRMASEDIGNADPRALQVAMAAWDAYERLGSPEGELALAQAVLYLASVPKSNAVYSAFNAASAFVRESESHPVPLHLRNAPTALMESLDYGKDYRYAHTEPDAYAAGENYWPDEMEAQDFYEPTERGLESKIKARLARLRELDERERGGD